MIRLQRLFSPSAHQHRGLSGGLERHSSRKTDISRIPVDVCANINICAVIPIGRSKGDMLHSIQRRNRTSIRKNETFKIWVGLKVRTRVTSRYSSSLVWVRLRQYGVSLLFSFQNTGKPFFILLISVLHTAVLTLSYWKCIHGILGVWISSHLSD